MTLWRRSVLAVTTTALLSTTAAILTTAPASAADDHVPTTTVAKAQWGYVDRATPTRAYLDPAGDAPVGAGAGRHVARSYFRFDLTAFDGAAILSAALSGAETRAADCAVRAVQVWRTDPLTPRSSWLRAPRERELLATAGPVEGRCPAPIDADVTAAVTAAVQRGDDAITVELRVPREHEDDRAYGRSAANDLKLVVAHNRPPATPTAHQVWPDRGCDPTAPGTYLNPDNLNDARRLVFMATVSDPDAGDSPTAEFAHWPVADPAAREVLQAPADAEGKVVAQAGNWLFPADGTHAWTVRALDGTAASPETTPCYFTIDRTLPATPVVSSQVYPPRGTTRGGGYGVPGDFTFTTTSDDAVAYKYRFNSSGDWLTATPAVPGGPATITYTPEVTGYQYITVHAVDRANNWSRTLSSYEFDILENRPFVFSPIYPADGVSYQGGVGVPGRFDFSSNLAGVTSYTYRIDDGPETTIAADAQRKASMTYTPTRGGYHSLKVRSTSSTGVSSPERVHRFLVDDAPVVTRTGGAIVGSSTQFSFRPRQADVVSYTYWFSRSNGPDTERVTIPAAPDGTGGFTWAPVAADVNSVNVFRVHSTDAAGVASETRRTEIYVDGGAPQVTVLDRGTPVRQARLEFTTRMVAPVEYEYWFDHSPDVRHTVPAVAGGEVAVALLPDRTGFLHLRARVRNAEGTWSVLGGASWSVSDQPDIVSADFPRDQSRPMREGAFTFTSNQVGAVEFSYRFDGVTSTVPVGPDGRATVRWTPQTAGEHWLQVTSRTAAGAVSSFTSYTFRIFDNPVVASTDFPASEYSRWREGTFTLTSTQSGAVEFLFTENGVTTTVPVGPDGVGTLRWTPTHNGSHQVTVTTRTAAGVVSMPTNYYFTIFDNPWVTSAEYPDGYHFVAPGTPGTFAFHPGRPDVVEYTYRFDLDYEPGEEHTVAATADGTASVTYAPPAVGEYLLTVTARAADGSTSSTEHFFGIFGGSD